MKIHIDTSSKKAQDQKVKTTGPTKKPATLSSTSPSSTPAPVKSKPLPKKPKKETSPPADVASARARQSTVLKNRMKRETQSTLNGPTRDVDKGPDLGYLTYPFL